MIILMYLCIYITIILKYLRKDIKILKWYVRLNVYSDYFRIHSKNLTDEEYIKLISIMVNSPKKITRFKDCIMEKYKLINPFICKKVQKLTTIIRNTIIE